MLHDESQSQGLCTQFSDKTKREMTSSVIIPKDKSISPPMVTSDPSQAARNRIRAVYHRINILGSLDVK